MYLLPEIAYREVLHIHPLKFSTVAIGCQLKEDGWLIPGSSDSLSSPRAAGACVALESRTVSL